MKAEKTRLLFEFINFGICDKEPIKTEIDKELSELEAKAAKWDDPQTQADLELAQATKLAFEHSHVPFTKTKQLVNWYREQKRGETNG